jgi:hypothetical protein
MVFAPCHKIVEAVHRERPKVDAEKLAQAEEHPARRWPVKKTFL